MVSINRLWLFKMVILSYEFALCFLLFFIVYWLSYRSIKLQNWLLVLASLAFLFTWQWQFVLSVVFVWLVLQWCLWIFSKTEKKSVKKWTFISGLIILIAHLCFFKYTNFTIAQLNDSILSEHNLSPLDIVLPVGISFYTFQAISYLVDVYKNKIQPMPSSVLLGFLSFFPTITAGPIFRAKDAEKQWLPEPVLTLNQQYSRPNRRYILYPYLAGALIMFALFKKIVLASWLETLWVSPVFSNPLQFHGLEVLTAVYAYSLQLFFDFSGYTDLVIALALLLGFRLPENFNRPYLATDVQDFWNKWHMTLSSWIKDYLYIPLGGNRCSFWRVQLNLMLAFVISGVWHGAGWNFFIWGAIHGLALVWLNLMKRWGVRHWLTKKAKPVAIFLTFHYVAFGWIFFHSSTFAQAGEMLLALTQYQSMVFSLSVIPTLMMMLLAWLLYPYLGRSREQVAGLLSYIPWWLLPIVISGYVVLVFALSPEGLPNFIYANF